MTSQGAVFSGTAFIAASACMVVMCMAWAAGWFVKWCRRVDAAADDLIRALSE